jgi:CubicO group peptidase (beta-lactamase class C family)
VSGLHAHWVRADGAVGQSGDPEAVVAWWSFTKTVMAAAALRLAATGALQLDVLLPGCSYTLRQLLQHRAGVPNYGGLAEYHAAVARRDVPWSRASLLEAVGADRTLFAPGTGWAYSNVGYLFVRDAIEGASGLPLDDALHQLVLARSDCRDVRLARVPDDLAGVAWIAGQGYHPGWVYHGLLVGNPKSAACLLHDILCGNALREDERRQMTDRQPLGGAVPGRPWTTHGYALGLMSGTMTGVGRAMGHTGVGPGSVAAIYHFPDRTPPVSVATFMPGSDDAPVEWAAARLASEVSCG